MTSRSGRSETTDSAGSRRLESLVPEVYDQLHQLAEKHFRRQSPGHTLQPTALVHECYLRLASHNEPRWCDRTHFYRVAAIAFRQILINHARGRGRLRRGGGRTRLEFNEGITISGPEATDVEALDEALEALAAKGEREIQRAPSLAGCASSSNASPRRTPSRTRAAIPSPSRRSAPRTRSHTGPIESSSGSRRRPRGRTSTGRALPRRRELCGRDGHRDPHQRRQLDSLAE